jgi:hypothetical protein
VTDETAMKNINGIIPDLILQLSHLSCDEHPLTKCDHLADTKTLNASENHYLLSDLFSSLLWESLL